MDELSVKASLRKVPEKMVKRNKHGEVIRENVYKQKGDGFWFNENWVDKYLQK